MVVEYERGMEASRCFEKIVVLEVIPSQKNTCSAIGKFVVKAMHYKLKKGPHTSP